MRDYFIHTSFDLVNKFEPRVPQERNSYEEDRTNRICVSTNLLGAVRGIPGSGFVIKQMLECNLPVIIHAYYLESLDYYQPSIQEVPDQDYTNEVWLLKEPLSVIRADYKMEKIQLKNLGKYKEKDLYYIMDADFHPIPYSDNLKNLNQKFHKAEYVSQVMNISFRSFMWNLGEELSDKIKEGGKQYV